MRRQQAGKSFNMNYFSSNLNVLAKAHPQALEAQSEIAVSRIAQLTEGSAEPTVKELIGLAEIFQTTIDRLIKTDMRAIEKIVAERKFRFLVLDVDGVMTDGGMYYTESGDEFKKFNTKDGIAIKSLTSKGILVAFLSSGFNEKLIQRRAGLLGASHVYVGREPKINILKKWCDDLKVPFEQVVCIGDDLNDLEIMKTVGLAACPADAIEEIKNTAAILLSRKGGDACVRELCEMLSFSA